MAGVLIAWVRAESLATTVTARLARVKPGYDPAVHLGGCGYLFMRGMIGANTPVRNGVTDGVFVWRPSVDLVVGADQVLGGGNA